MTLKKAFLIILVSFVWLIGSLFVIAAIDHYTEVDMPGETMLVSFIGFYVLFVCGAGVWAGAKGYSVALGIFPGRDRHPRMAGTRVSARQVEKVSVVHMYNGL